MAARKCEKCEEIKLFLQREWREDARLGRGTRGWGCGGIYQDICGDIYGDIYSDIYSDIYPDIYPDIGDFCFVFAYWKDSGAFT